MHKNRKSKIIGALAVVLHVLSVLSIYFMANEIYVHEMNCVLTGSLIFQNCCSYIKQKEKRNILIETRRKEINILQIGIKENIVIFVMCSATAVALEILRLIAMPIYAYVDMVLFVCLLVLELKDFMYTLAEKTKEN